MGAPHHVYLVSLLAAVAMIEGILSVEYTVTNNAKDTIGGHRFHSEIGENYAKTTMKYATNFIWVKFHQFSRDDREQVKQVDLFIDEMEETSTFQFNNQNGQIHISENHIASCSDDYVKQDFTNLLYYELTHILQWKAKGQIPEALRDGIAAFMVLLSVNYKTPMGWVEYGEGDRWNQSPNVTAQFFQYCTILCHPFLPRLNEKMKDSYEERYFEDVTGKTISAAWKTYRGMLGG